MGNAREAKLFCARVCRGTAGQPSTMRLGSSATTMPQRLLLVKAREGRNRRARLLRPRTLGVFVVENSVIPVTTHHKSTILLLSTSPNSIKRSVPTSDIAYVYVVEKYDLPGLKHCGPPDNQVDIDAPL